MPLVIHAGHLVGLLYFAAGVAALSAVIGAFLKFEDFGLRGHKWLAALCASVSVYLVAIALHHTADSLAAALAAHKWIDITALLNLCLLCAFVARQTPVPDRALRLVAAVVAGLAAITALASVQLPYGARYAGVSAVEPMVFPWGERLLILRGETTAFADGIKLLMLVPFVCLGAQFVALYRAGERGRAGLMAVGAAVIVLGVALTGLIDCGRLDFVYPAGLGYMVFVIFAVIHASRGARGIITQVRKLSAAVEQSPNGILLVNAENRIEYANRSFLAMTGYAPEQVLGVRPNALRAQGAAPAAADIVEALEGGRAWRGELSLRCPAGGELAVFAVVSPMRAKNGRATNFVMEMEDLTQHKTLAAGLQLYASVFENGGEGSVICDSNNRIVTVNAAFTRITGYGLDEVRGRNPRMLSAGLTPAETYRDMWATLEREGYWQGEVVDRRKDGSVFPKWLTISVVRDAAGATTHYVGSFSDITERKAVEDRIAFLAHHDPLTGLLNRFSLQSRVEQALASARRDSQRVALGIFDLDRFKQVNDTLGHAVGDQLLIEVARRLRDNLRQSDVLARLGGDEFVVALTDVGGANAAARVADKLLAALHQPYHLAGRELNLGASLGIAMFPDDGPSAELLMKNADIAMYHAKTQGRNNPLFFTAAMNDAVVDRMRLEQELREAIRLRQFELHYQPKFAAAIGQITGFEALLRWRHPVHGLLGPDRFIPVAEETGLILPLGRWVVREACRQLRAWRSEGFAALSVAVNVSAHQLRALDLPQVVEQALRGNQLDGASLELEITESAAMENPESSIAQLNELSRLGVRLAIDDFGTGYSSLAYLKRLPVDCLKLDRSFVRDIESDPNDKAICTATVALAHSLGLTVVAEGIETEVQRDFLHSLHCDQFQGYFFGRPMPAGEALALVRTLQPTARTA